MAPAVPEVALEAELLVLAQLAVLSLLEVVADLSVLAQLAVLVPLELVAELVVEELLHRSFSSAMAGILRSTGTPRYSPVPRSGRKAKRRP